MYLAPSKVPNTEIKPTKTHADISSDTEAWLSKGNSVEVIQRREPSPASKTSCSDIR